MGWCDGSGKPTSKLSSLEGEDLSSQINSLQRMQDVQSSIEDVQIRLYDGRIRGGSYAGEKVTIKMYPKTVECDILAANELKMHEELQPPKTQEECLNLGYLIGGYLTHQAQCLVFRRTGEMSLAQYCRLCSEALEKGTAIGSGDVWDILDPKRTLKRRRKVFVRIFRDIATGLQFMHNNKKLHQSLGPDSITLSNFGESDCSDLRVQVSDLALGMDISINNLAIQETLGDVWDYANHQEMLRNSPLLNNDLWTRARMSGAWSEFDRQNFGIADDVAALGFLFLYTILFAFSPKGSIDGPTLYRQVQITFDADISQFTSYCEEDENFSAAVEFLNMGEKAGWELISAMINKEWKSRPTAGSCLSHRFLNGSLFLDEI